MISQQTLPSQKRLRVLDLGCGNGSLSNLIAQQGHEVVGAEESESGIKAARLSFPTGNFIHASIYDLPYSELENSFDIVISIEVIEHLLYPKELLRAAKIVLNQGKMDQHFTTLWDGGHIKFLSTKTMTALLQSEGYVNINFKFAGRLPYLWKSMLCSSSLVQR